MVGCGHFGGVRDGTVAVVTLQSSMKVLDWWPLSWVKQNVNEFQQIEKENMSGRFVFMCA